MRKLMTTGLMVMGLASGLGMAAPQTVLAETPAVAPAASPEGATPAKLALVKRMFSAMHFDAMMSQMMRSMMPAMMQQQRQAHPEITDAQVSVITEVSVETMNEYLPKMTDAMAQVYAEVFTEDELKQIVAFYEGPTGQAMVAKTPLVMQKLMPVMMSMTPQMQADMTAKICAKTSCTPTTNPAKAK